MSREGQEFCLLIVPVGYLCKQSETEMLVEHSGSSPVVATTLQTPFV